MEQIITPKDIGRLGTILAVWAHPDDETFVAGGLLAAAVANGQKVVCVTATRGGAGQTADESRWPRAHLRDIRTKELEAALKILGVTEHNWLSYEDGHCADADQDEAVAKIAELLKVHQPDSIITFGPDGLTGHPDHQAVSRWASAAAANSKIRIYHVVYDTQQHHDFLVPFDKQVNLFYRTDKPPLVPADQCDIALTLTSELFDKKWRALEAMPSQMTKVITAAPLDKREGIFGREYFVLA